MVGQHLNNVLIEGTACSPEINFDYLTNTFSIRGESYPEDVTAFYGKPIEGLKAKLSELREGGIEFNFELIYFNSSSAKVLMGIFDILEEVGTRGVAVTVNWFHDEEDENMVELGEEFAEDLNSVVFNMKVV